jgi:signal transduction histidine kinase
MMKRFLKFSRLQTRLLVAYAGLIVTGFGLLAVLAGQQIQSSAYRDFEQRVLSEVLLIGQGLKEPLGAFLSGDLSEDELISEMNRYEEQIGGKLLVRTIKDNKPIFVSEIGDFGGDPHKMPELESASRGTVILNWRPDSKGVDTIFTAAPIGSRRGLIGYVQIQVPCSNVFNVLAERWAILGLAVLGITSLSLLVGIWLSSTLTRPLEQLRLSAVEISRGNLAHRVLEPGEDEIGQVGNAFNQMAHQIQSMVEEQRAFASNASHELKTPLTTIRLRTEALRHDTALSDEIKTRYIAEIDDETTRLSTLIEDLILLSRLDAGRIAVGSDRIEIGRFARNLHFHLNRQAAKKNIDFQLDLEDGGEIFIEANLNHLTILFRNLLDNALKYTPPDGKLIWCISHGADTLHTTIQDTGQGISAQDLAHIFERFYRADKAHSRKVPGSGLGLALAQAIINSYGAKIQVQSPGEGQGTTVIIDWPLKALAPEA